MESEIVEGALELDTLRACDLMTPRAKMIWLNIHEPHESVWHKIVVSGHSTFPVYDGNRDNVVGMVTVKSLYAHLAQAIPIKLRDLVTPALVVPALQTAVQLLESMNQAGRHTALVTDEFGGIVGFVTLHDIMEAILGDFPTQEQRSRPSATKRADGSWLVDGLAPLEEVERAVPDLRFPSDTVAEVQTLAGVIMKQFGRVPREGETFVLQGYTFEVLDMDRHRVDKVLIMPPASPRDRVP